MIEMHSVSYISVSYRQCSVEPWLRKAAEGEEVGSLSGYLLSSGSVYGDRWLCGPTVSLGSRTSTIDL